MHLLDKEQYELFATMPEDNSYAGFMSPYVESEIEWLAKLKQRYGNDKSRRDSGELGFKQLDAMSAFLPTIICETETQQKHVAELMQKLGLKTEAAVYLYKKLSER